MTVKLRSRSCIALLRNSVFLFGTIALAIDPAISAPLLPVAPASTSDTSSLVQSVRAMASGGRAVVGPRGGAVVHRGGAVVGPRGAAYRGRTAVVGPRGNAAVRRTTVVRPGYAGGGVRWARPSRYYWPRGGAIAAGAAIGVVTAATAAAWAGAAPAPGMCWYYTDPSRTQGFWDYCQ
jgi:hypothetical protein